MLLLRYSNVASALGPGGLLKNTLNKSTFYLVTYLYLLKLCNEFWQHLVLSRIIGLYLYERH